MVWDRFSVGSTHHVAMRSALMMLLGSLLLFTAFLSMVSDAGGQNWDLEYLQTYEYSLSFQQWVFPVICLGFGILAGLFPFHAWCADGQASAPTALSMLHAGILMKIGIFGLIRIGMVSLPEGAASWTYLLGCLAIVQ